MADNNKQHTLDLNDMISFHEPKPKPRKGQTQEENEQDWAEQLTLKGFDSEDFIASEDVKMAANFEIAPSVDLSFAGTDDTIYNEATYLDHSTTVSISHGFVSIEEKHEEIRKRYPALEKAYDHYRVLLKLAESGPEDVDN